MGSNNNQHAYNPLELLRSEEYELLAKYLYSSTPINIQTFLPIEKGKYVISYSFL